MATVYNHLYQYDDNSEQGNLYLVCLCQVGESMHNLGLRKPNLPVFFLCVFEARFLFIALS